MIGRILVFVSIFVGLQLTWQELGASPVRAVLIDRGVVAPAAAIAAVLSPGLGVHAVGSHLRGPVSGINVVDGCDGMETLFLLSAGFAVAPLPLRSRAWGFAVGLSLVYVLNLARILALFYALQFAQPMFDWLHGLVTPILMVLTVVGFYQAWLRRFQRPAAH
jgi:exosortase/archaeosortase family protein